MSPNNIPDKETVFKYTVAALKKESFLLGGDVSGFKDALYVAFLEFLGKSKYTEKKMERFLNAVLDELLFADEPERAPEFDFVMREAKHGS